METVERLQTALAKLSPDVLSAIYRELAHIEIAETLNGWNKPPNADDLAKFAGLHRAAAEPPPLPDHLTDRHCFAGENAKRITHETARKPVTPGRRSYVELVKVGRLEPHPTPYTRHLAVTRVHGLPIVVGRDEFREGDLAIYLPVGTGLPPTDALAFIHQHKNYTVRTRNFRGVESCGVLLPVWEFFWARDDKTGRRHTASADCWNDWCSHLVGLDVSAGLDMSNPT